MLTRLMIRSTLEARDETHSSNFIRVLMAVKHWIVFTVVKTKTGSWARTLLASGGAVWGVCPYTDTLTDTRHCTWGRGQRVNKVSRCLHSDGVQDSCWCQCQELVVASKSLKVATQFPTKKRKLNHHNYPDCPGLEYKNSRGRLHGVTVVQNLNRNLRFYPCLVMFTEIWSVWLEKQIGSASS